MLRDWQVITYHDVTRSRSIVMEQQSIGVGCTAHPSLQKRALVNGPFDQFAFDFDPIIDAQENLKFFPWRRRFYTGRTDILTTYKDAGITTQEYTFSRVRDGGPQ